jgi:hypothetical protein
LYDTILDEYEDESTRTRIADQPFDEAIVAPDVDDDDVVDNQVGVEAADDTRIRRRSSRFDCTG